MKRASLYNTAVVARLFKYILFAILGIGILFGGFALWKSFGNPNECAVGGLSIGRAGVARSTSAYESAVDLAFQVPKDTFCVGDIVKLTLVVDSPDQAMNTAAGTVTFDPNKLQLVGVDTTGSIIDLWVNDPAASTTALSASRAISFGGGVLSTGFKGSQGKIFTASFKVISTGQTTVGIVDPKVLADDGAGTDLLSSASGSDLTLLAPVASRMGDLNGDGKVDITDVSIMLANYGKRVPALDLDGSGVVGIRDVASSYLGCQNRTRSPVIFCYNVLRGPELHRQFSGYEPDGLLLPYPAMEFPLCHNGASDATRPALIGCYHSCDPISVMIRELHSRHI